MNAFHRRSRFGCTVKERTLIIDLRRTDCDHPCATAGLRYAREGVRISRSQLSKALRKNVPLPAPRHTLKGRQVASEVDRIGLRLQLREQQARAGDIVLLYGDESEALTHPYLARAWAKSGDPHGDHSADAGEGEGQADQRPIAFGQSPQFAIGGLGVGGDLWMQNEAGVITHLKAKRTGLMLSLAEMLWL
jgi:hypothetical protein